MKPRGGVGLLLELEPKSGKGSSGDKSEESEMSAAESAADVALGGGDKAMRRQALLDLIDMRIMEMYGDEKE